MKKSPFGFKRAKDSPGFLLWKMTMAWQRLVKKTLDEFNITHPQFVILAVTAWRSLQGCIVTQRLLTAESKLDKMTISISVKKLVSEGFLRQFDHLEDARAKQIELTPRGEKMANKLIPLIEAVDEEFFSALSKKYQNDLIQIGNELLGAHAKA